MSKDQTQALIDRIEQLQLELNKIQMLCIEEAPKSLAICGNYPRQTVKFVLQYMKQLEERIAKYEEASSAVLEGVHNSVSTSVPDSLANEGSST